jgi:phosphate:Na+ symporter
VNEFADISKIIAGIAIFLLGNVYLEKGVHKLASRRFKLFLRKHSSNPFKAVVGGALVAAVLQSSSVVNLMILAFVGAGVITMKNALGIVLGSNLGTTISNWIIVFVGFKLNLENAALAITGVAGLTVVMTAAESRGNLFARIALGIGFLFTGLSFIKSGMENFIKHVEVGAFADQPLIIFLLVGIFITSLIQSSSATVAIVLSALHINAIELLPGMAIVLGAEVGTTLKFALASMRGLAVKKRVSLGNFLVNLITSIVVIVFINQLHHFTVHTLHVQDPLLALVCFQSLVNVTSILLFLPLLLPLSKWLDRLFTKDSKESLFIRNVRVTDTELAAQAADKEVRHFLSNVCQLGLAVFQMPGMVTRTDEDFYARGTMGKYLLLKQINGELIEYCVLVRNSAVDNETVSCIERLLSASRNGMHAAKSLKDAVYDIEQLRNSSNNIKYRFYEETSAGFVSLYRRVFDLITGISNPDVLDSIVELYHQVQHTYSQALKSLYSEGAARGLNEVDFSTLINYNREMYSANKALLFALKDYLLSDSEALSFEELPPLVY